MEHLCNKQVLSSRSRITYVFYCCRSVTACKRMNRPLSSYTFVHLLICLFFNFILNLYALLVSC